MKVLLPRERIYANPPVNDKVLKTKRRIIVREYRNRRIGDFLKEMQLTEGRGTGFPAIYDAMEANGSPKPIFETDNDRSYFLSIIPVHALADRTFGHTSAEAGSILIFNTLEDIISFINRDRDDITNDITNQVCEIVNREVHRKVKKMLVLLQRRLSRTELFEKMGITNQSFNRKKYLDPLLSFGWVEKEFPDKQSTKQTYKITESGKRTLLLLNKS